ncbi:MAG: ABC transporter substrate-binding protein [Bacteroidetes bacterium]|nr:MAG: ABC transporter substrate-binding protein [Bacteroidota bacterium]
MRKPGLYFLVFLLFAFTFSCKGPYEDYSHLSLFRYNEDGSITSLDPVYARNQANIWATSQIFNGLVQLDTLLIVKPAIAHSWDISDDGTVYTFYLRNDVYFHDDESFEDFKGRRVVAEDFIFSFARLTDPTLNSPGSWVMNPVARRNDGTLDIEALSDTVLQIRLKEPFPPMAGLLCMQYCSVVPREAVEARGQDFRKSPVGTGPFHFQYWKEGVKLVFRKNEKYFEFDGSDRLPYLDAVAITFIQDRQTAFLEFIKGNLDILTRIDASYKDELLTPHGELQEKHQERFYKRTGPFLNTEYLGILVDNNAPNSLSALQKRKVRQAINYGFDREKMLKYLRNNLGTPAHAGFVPVGMPGFDKNEGGFTYQPDKARRLLAEAGFPNGEGLPAIELSTTSLYMDIGQYIQHELARIGIRMQINVMPPATLREMMAKADAPFFRGSWIADYPDAENYLALFYSKNHTPAGPNYTRFTSHEFDRLYEKSSSVVDDSLRFEYYRKLDRIIIEEAPVVPLFYDQSVRFLPHYVQGLETNPLNHMLLKRVRIENSTDR